MTSSIAKTIDIDIKYGCTPDLPSLRYHGRNGIYVFLWDDMTTLANVQAVTNSSQIFDEYRSEYSEAITVDPYMCWYNLKAPYAAHMLNDPDAIPFLDLEAYQEGELLPVKGKLVTVSLDLLQELDMYYNNGVDFTRVRLDVYPTVYATTKMNVFTWMNSIDQLGAWNKDVNHYKLKDTIDITPMNIGTKNGKKFYEM